MGSSICTEQLRLCGNYENDPEQVQRKSEIQTVMKHVKSMESMKKKYKMTDTVLGVGSFGKVLLWESTSDPTLKYSTKIVSKELLGTNLANFREVYEVLNKISHPGILKYYDFYENDTYFYLVMELFEGQQLLDLIISYANNNNGWMPEATAKDLLK